MMKKPAAERRRAPRSPARFKVRFWNEEIDGTGLTTNVAAAGLFIQTRRPPPKSTRLHLEIEIDGQSFHAEGVVARVQTVSPTVASIVPPGMGVRFLPWVEVVEVAEAATPEDPSGLTLDLREPEKLRAVVENEIRGGGLLVPTNEPFEIGDSVTLHVVLPATHGGATVEGRVVRQLDNPPSIGLELMNPGAVLAQLTDVLHTPVAATDAPIQTDTRFQMVVSTRGVPTVAECTIQSLTPCASCADLPLGGFRVLDEGSPVTAPAAPTSDDNSDLMSMDLSDPTVLRTTYEQQLQNGALFVPTDSAIELHENICVYIKLPPPHGILEVKGKVVHKSTTPPGLGLELANQVVIDAALAPIVALLSS